MDVDDAIRRWKNKEEKRGHKVEFPVGVPGFVILSRLAASVVFLLIFQWVERMYVTQKGLRKCVAYASAHYPADWTPDESRPLLHICKVQPYHQVITLLNATTAPLIRHWRRRRRENLLAVCAPLLFSCAHTGRRLIMTKFHTWERESHSASLLTKKQLKLATNNNGVAPAVTSLKRFKNKKYCNYSD